MLANQSMSPSRFDPAVGLPQADVLQRLQSGTALDQLLARPAPIDRFGSVPGTTYTVKRGDTLTDIAAKFGTTWQTLARINGIANPDMIRPGQQIRLPAGTAATYTVRPGDTLSEIAAANNTTVSALARANNISNPNRIFPGQILRLGGSASPAPTTPQPRPTAPQPTTAPPTANPNTTTGQIDLDRFLDASQGSNALSAIIIGNAEGTRTPNGGTTRAYGSHIDPGNKVANRGSFSLQNAGDVTPQRADQIQIGRLAQQRPAYEAAARRAGLDPNNAVLATAYFDLQNQSPRAASRFLNQIGYLSQAGISNASVTELRVRSFVDVTTGQRFPGAGTGFETIARDRLGRTPTEAEVQSTLRADQTRRQNAMAAAMTAQGVGTAQAAAAVRPVARPPAGNGPINTVLPASGPGFTTYNREAGGADQYGRSSFIADLQALGAAWSRTGNEPISFGDLSRRGGGAFPPHSGHRNGNEADIRPFRTDRANAPTNIFDASYDRATTRELVQLIRAQHPGAVILFNDPQLIREGLVRPAAGHDNHLHIRL